MRGPSPFPWSRSPGGAMVNSQGCQPLGMSDPRIIPVPVVPKPRRGDRGAPRSSVPEISLVVLDSMPSQEREELLLKGHLPVMLGLPRQVSPDLLAMRSAHREHAVTGLPGEIRQRVGKRLMKPTGGTRLDNAK